MRDIKFRAWNGQSMIMPRTNAYYQHYLSFCGNITQKNSEGMECFGGGDRWSRVEKLELMQFTGLQDKNGVDIYEGDILFHKVQGARKVIYPMSESLASFGLVAVCGKKNTLGNSDKLYTIIGNIHQTPELLESTK